MPSVRALVFDWYGTLAMPDPDDWWVRLRELIVAHGGVVDEQALTEWEVGHPLLHTEHSTSETVYRAWQRRRLDAVFARCAIADPTPLLDYVEDTRYRRVFTTFPEARRSILEAREAGLTVGVCSNWDWDLDRQLAHNGLEGLLDFVVCSAVVGCRKPHRSIFDLVVTQAGCRPDQIVFVGDAWGDDVEGARAASIQPVHVWRAGPCPTADHHGVPCVGDLSEVVPLAVEDRK